VSQFNHGETIARAEQIMRDYGIQPSHLKAA
jgi:hypothetical protein